MAINVRVKQPKKINVNVGRSSDSELELLKTYNWPAPTGQTTEYATYDDAWQYFNIWKPVFESEAGKKRIVPRLLDFFTLVDNNSFGNKNRFTDENGLQDYNNDYVVDNYTGLGWKLTFVFDTWANLLTLAAGYSNDTLGFDEFYFANTNHMSSLFHQPSFLNNYSPFSDFNNTLRNNWSSTTSRDSNDRAYIVSGRFHYEIESFGKTASHAGYFYRKHF